MMARQLEVRAIFDGIDEDGYTCSHFEPNVRVTRGLFECCACGAKQADYAISDTDPTVTARKCERCGNDEELYFLELWGTVDGGPEINLVPVYERDVWPLLQPTPAPPTGEEG